MSRAKNIAVTGGVRGEHLAALSDASPTTHVVPLCLHPSQNAPTDGPVTARYGAVVVCVTPGASPPVTAYLAALRSESNREATTVAVQSDAPQETHVGDLFEAITSATRVVIVHLEGALLVAAAHQDSPRLRLVQISVHDGPVVVVSPFNIPLVDIGLVEARLSAFLGKSVASCIACRYGADLVLFQAPSDDDGLTTPVSVVLDVKSGRVRHLHTIAPESGLHGDIAVACGTQRVIDVRDGADPSCGGLSLLEGASWRHLRTFGELPTLVSSHTSRWVYLDQNWLLCIAWDDTASRKALAHGLHLVKRLWVKLPVKVPPLAGHPMAFFTEHLLVMIGAASGELISWNLQGLCAALSAASEVVGDALLRGLPNPAQSTASTNVGRPVDPIDTVKRLFYLDRRSRAFTPTSAVVVDHPRPEGRRAASPAVPGSSVSSRLYNPQRSTMREKWREEKLSTARRSLSMAHISAPTDFIEHFYERPVAQREATRRAALDTTDTVRDTATRRTCKRSTTRNNLWDSLYDEAARRENRLDKTTRPKAAQLSPLRR